MEDLIKNLSLVFALAFGFALTGSLFCLSDYKQENMMLKKKLVDSGMAHYNINDKGELVLFLKIKKRSKNDFHSKHRMHTGQIYCAIIFTE